MIRHRGILLSASLIVFLFATSAAIAAGAAHSPPAPEIEPVAAKGQADIKVDLEDRTGVQLILGVPENMPIPLLPQPGESLAGVPAGLGDGVLYGVLQHASPDGLLSLLVHRGAGGSERVILDANDNEDLTDDPSLSWEGSYETGADGRQVLPTLRTTIDIRCPGQSLPVSLALVLRRFERERVTPGPTANVFPNGILATIDSYRGGAAVIGGSERALALIPTRLSAQGAFNHRGTALVIDLNGDGKLDGNPLKSRERFRAGAMFQVGAQAYQVRETSCDGKSLVLASVDPVLAALGPRPSGPGPAQGDQAPDFALPTITGDTLRLSDYRGKIVLLDFWATWCGPCRSELPHVREAYQRYHPRGFEIVGVSLDQTPEKLKEFIKANDMTWPQIFQGRGAMTPLKQSYMVKSIPSTFLLDRDGRVVATQLRGAQLAQVIEALLRTDPARSD